MDCSIVIRSSISELMCPAGLLISCKQCPGLEREKQPQSGMERCFTRNHENATADPSTASAAADFAPYIILRGKRPDRNIPPNIRRRMQWRANARFGIGAIS